MYLNTYNNIREPKTTGQIPVQNWLNKIQNSEYSEKINHARLGLSNYDEVKSSLPAVTYNFTYDGYKKDSNTISSTNHIYIDIDNPSFDINTLNKDKVSASYKSFGGKGYGIICSTSGITLNSFKENYISICKELNIENYIDKNAVKASQFTVLSFDKDIFINPNPYQFNFSSTEDLLNPKYPYDHCILKKENIYNDDRGKIKFIRYSNLDYIKLDSPYIVDWSGIDEIKCTIPIQKLTDGRKRCLIAYCANYVYLNDWLPFENILKTMNQVNLTMCVKPLGYKIVYSIVNSIYQQLRENRLEPIYNTRKIVFSKDSGFNREEKLAICAKENGLKRTDEVKQRLYGLIEGWDFEKFGKITQTKVHSNFAINRLTVEKYWKEFKDYVAELNLKFKNS